MGPTGALTALVLCLHSAVKLLYVSGSLRIAATRSSLQVCTLKIQNRTPCQLRSIWSLAKLIFGHLTFSNRTTMLFWAAIFVYLILVHFCCSLWGQSVTSRKYQSVRIPLGKLTFKKMSTLILNYSVGNRSPTM